MFFGIARICPHGELRFSTVNFSDFKTSVYHLHLFYLMRVNPFPLGSIIHFYVLSFSLLTGVPVLFFGPKGVRLLLAFRAFVGADAPP